jgi:hypothetical protein
MTAKRDAMSERLSDTPGALNDWLKGSETMKIRFFRDPLSQRNFAEDNLIFLLVNTSQSHATLRRPK